MKPTSDDIRFILPMITDGQINQLNRFIKEKIIGEDDSSEDLWDDFANLRHGHRNKLREEQRTAVDRYIS